MDGYWIHSKHFFFLYVYFFLVCIISLSVQTVKWNLNEGWLIVLSARLLLEKCFHSQAAHVLQCLRKTSVPFKHSVCFDLVQTLTNSLCCCWPHHSSCPPSWWRMPIHSKKIWKWSLSLKLSCCLTSLPTPQFRTPNPRLETSISVTASR